ncbi:MAG: zinc-dependent peptidase [Chitinophagales bacterium]|nr:zinc-dependent peptidase [Chitinophagales bacterium]
MLGDFISSLFGNNSLHGEPLSIEDIALLQEHVFYYAQLPEHRKTDFEQQVSAFLAHVSVHFDDVEPSRLVELLVASSAVIVTFGHAFHYKNQLSKVVIVKAAVSKFESGFTLGEVRYNGHFTDMYLSESALIQGFKNNNDKSNVGIHEFVHILDSADGVLDGLPTHFMSAELIKLWMKVAEDEMANIKADESTIRAYGATNEQEFLTVCSEYFFERPEKLIEEHPEVYALLSRTFLQDPAETYDFQDKANFGKDKTKVDRNDPCPCGSGKKYKKCCLLNE